MTTRRVFLKNAAQAGTVGLVSTAGLSLPGCGGSSMASSAFPDGLQLRSAAGFIPAPLSPDQPPPAVTIRRTPGGNPTGGFDIPLSTGPRANQTIFVLATFDTQIPGVNPALYSPTAVLGDFQAIWSEVLPNPSSPRIVTFDSSAGTTFSGSTQAGTITRVFGESGNFIVVSQPGPVVLRLAVRLQLADGSRQNSTLEFSLNVAA